MAINHKWNIVEMERTTVDGVENVVKDVHWELIATEEDLTERAYGTVTLADPDPNNFIAFEDLRERKVAKWVRGTMGTEVVKSLKQSLGNAIKEKRTPKKLKGVPPLFKEEVI